MKTLLLAAIALSSTVSFAGEICGTVGSHTEGPRCTAGEMCPDYMRLQYDLTTSDGTRYDLETSETAVLENFGQFLGSKVCVNGVEKADGIFVSEIAAQSK
jgi:hypothetical protein